MGKILHPSIANGSHSIHPETELFNIVSFTHRSTSGALHTTRRHRNPRLALTKGFLDGRPSKASPRFVNAWLFGVFAPPAFWLCTVTYRSEFSICLLECWLFAYSGSDACDNDCCSGQGTSTALPITIHHTMAFMSPSKLVIWRRTDLVGANYPSARMGARFCSFVVHLQGFGGFQQNWTLSSTSGVISPKSRTSPNQKTRFSHDPRK